MKTIILEVGTVGGQKSTLVVRSRLGSQKLSLIFFLGRHRGSHPVNSTFWKLAPSLENSAKKQHGSKESGSKSEITDRNVYA